MINNYFNIKKNKSNAKINFKIIIFFYLVTGKIILSMQEEEVSCYSTKKTKKAVFTLPLLSQKRKNNFFEIFTKKNLFESKEMNIYLKYLNINNFPEKEEINNFITLLKKIASYNKKIETLEYDEKIYSHLALSDEKEISEENKKFYNGLIGNFIIGNKTNTEIENISKNFNMILEIVKKGDASALLGENTKTTLEEINKALAAMSKTAKQFGDLAENIPKAFDQIVEKNTGSFNKCINNITVENILRLSSFCFFMYCTYKIIEYLLNKEKPEYKNMNIQWLYVQGLIAIAIPIINIIFTKIPSLIKAYVKYNTLYIYNKKNKITKLSWYEKIFFNNILSWHTALFIIGLSCSMLFYKELKKNNLLYMPLMPLSLLFIINLLDENFCNKYIIKGGIPLLLLCFLYKIYRDHFKERTETVLEIFKTSSIYKIILKDFFINTIPLGALYSLQKHLFPFIDKKTFEFLEKNKPKKVALAKELTENNKIYIEETLENYLNNGYGFLNYYEYFEKEDDKVELKIEEVNNNEEEPKNIAAVEESQNKEYTRKELFNELNTYKILIALENGSIEHPYNTLEEIEHTNTLITLEEKILHLEQALNNNTTESSRINKQRLIAMQLDYYKNTVNELKKYIVNLFKEYEMLKEEKDDLKYKYTKLFLDTLVKKTSDYVDKIETLYKNISNIDKSVFKEEEKNIKNQLEDLNNKIENIDKSYLDQKQKKILEEAQTAFKETTHFYDKDKKIYLDKIYKLNYILSKKIYIEKNKQKEIDSIVKELETIKEANFKTTESFFPKASVIVWNIFDPLYDKLVKETGLNFNSEIQ